MRFLAKTFCATLLVLALLAPANAGMRLHGSTASAPPTTQSGAQEDFGLYTEFVPANFIDVLKAGYFFFGGGATPGTAAMDSNGYPTRSFTGTVYLINDQTQWTGVPYVVTWSSGTQLQLAFSSASSCSVSGTGGSFTGCISGGGVTLTIDGTGAGSMTFTPGSVLTMQFPGTGTYGAANTAALTLMRVSDVSTYAAYAVAGNIAGAITPEFLTVLQGMHMKTMRTMAWDNTNDTNQTQWRYRSPPSAMSWNYHYPLGTWSGGAGSAGAITGTDIYSAALAPDQSTGAWTQGETFMGSVTNASSPVINVSFASNNGAGLCRLTVNSTTTLTTGQSVWVSGLLDTSFNSLAACNGVFTITVVGGTLVDLQGTTFSGTYGSSGWVGVQTLAVTGKTGPKFIGSLQAYPPGANYDQGIQPGIGTFVYDSILDKVLYTNNGIMTSVPIETNVSIANQIGANLWSNIPAMADDNYVTQWATGALGLNSNLYFMPEYGNEVWNSQFTGTQWAQARGFAFGFPGLSNRAVYGYYGLRVRQAMGNLIPAVWSSRMSKLRRTLMVQAYSDGPTNELYRMSGSDLAPSGTSTGIGNSVYDAFTGSANYTTAPNRPVDVVETMGYAAYTTGTNLSDQGLNGGLTASAMNAPILQTWATALAANPNDPTTLASIDNDQSQGTTYTQTYSVSCPVGASTFTVTGHGFTNFFESILFTVSGGTICNGLTANIAYCPINITTNTFQVAAYNSDGTCGSSAISVTPGTGSVTVGAVPQGNVLAVLEAIIFPRWETVAAFYDSSRPSGMAPLRVEQYEGASEPVVPSASALTALGVLVPAGTGTGAAANAALVNGLNAWKNTYGSSFILYDFGLFEAFSHSKTPSNFVILGAYSPTNPYGIVNGSLPNSTVYGGYNGFAAFVGVP
jgi:hypothetical protein